MELRLQRGGKGGQGKMHAILQGAAIKVAP